MEIILGKAGHGKTRKIVELVKERGNKSLIISGENAPQYYTNKLAGCDVVVHYQADLTVARIQEVIIEYAEKEDIKDVYVDVPRAFHYSELLELSKPVTKLAITVQAPDTSSLKGIEVFHLKGLVDGM